MRPQEALKEAVEDAGFEATLLSQGGLETLTLKVGVEWLQRGTMGAG